MTKYLKSPRVLTAFAVTVVSSAGLGLWAWNRPQATVYRDVKVHRGEIALSTSATGTVQPENRLDIKPPVAGRVDQVLVKAGQKVKKGQILAWMSSSERATLMDAARALGEKEVKRWERNYRSTPIISPIDGTVIQRNVEAGQSFSNSDAILVMSDRLTIKTHVDETDIALVKVDQPTEIVLDAYSGDHLPAKVDKIAFDASLVDKVTTYDVDVLPDHAPPEMRSGMTANVTFILKTERDALLVPRAAVRTGESGNATVLVRNQKGGVEERGIKIGISDDNQIQVLEGLTERDSVLEPVRRLSPRTRGRQTVNMNPSAKQNVVRE